MFIHLVGSDDRILYQFDGIPYGGRHPPCQWRVGEIFADRYEIYPRPAANALATSGITDTLATLTLGFYPVLRPQERLAVLDANGNPAGDRVQLAKIRILPEESMPATLQLAAGRREAGAWRARWQNGIALQDVTVLAQADGPQSVCSCAGKRNKTGSVITRSLCRRWMPAASW